MTLEEAFDIVLTMARQETDARMADTSPAIQAVAAVDLQAVDLVTAFYLLNVKGDGS
jgi:hypothetical protein